MNKVDIIIPAYNAEKTIIRCLDSIILGFKSSPISVGIIVVNDGSTDRTQAIINEYTEIHPSVVLINTENQGVSSARNRGLKESTANWILFIDADDYVLENWLEIIEDGINRSSSSSFDMMIFNHFREHQGESRRASCISENISYTPDEAIQGLFNGEINNAPWAKLFRGEIIKSTGFVNGISVGEDLLAISECLDKSVCILFNVNAFYVYTESATGVTRNPVTPKKIKDILYVIEAIERKYVNYKNKKLFGGFVYRQLVAYLFNANFLYFIRYGGYHYISKAALNAEAKEIYGFKKRVAMYLIRFSSKIWPQ